MSLDRFNVSDNVKNTASANLSVDFASQKSGDTKSLNTEISQKLVDSKVLPQCDFFDSCKEASTNPESKKPDAHTHPESKSDLNKQGDEQEKPDDRKYAPLAQPQAPSEMDEHKPSNRVYNRPITTEEYQRQLPGIPVKPVDNARYLPPTK